MKRMTGFLAAGFFVFLVFSSVGEASLGQVTLAWDRNTEPDLAGYKLHYGTVSGSYSSHIDVGNVDHYTVTGLPGGFTYHFVATAYDTSGNESDYSNQVSTEIVVYISVEDGEDSSGWVKTQGTGTMGVVFSSDFPPSGSNVLVFRSSAPTAYTVFRLDLNSSGVSSFNLDMDLKYIQNLNTFFAFDVTTDAGDRRLVYKPYNSPVPNPSSSSPTSTVINCGFNSSIRDGSWHSLVLYLQDDLTFAQPGKNILRIKYFYVYACGLSDSLQIGNMEFFAD